MSINIGPPQVDELKPRIAVIGVGGAGGNAIANMIAARVEGVDFIVAKKVFRKFESLSLGFMKDELSRFAIYIDKLFGKGKMPVCLEYIERLQKMS